MTPKVPHTEDKITRYRDGSDDIFYLAINAYELVDNPQEWNACPTCGLIPKVWLFDNGRSTACGCGKSKYDHHSVHAESIMSVHMRTDGKGLDKYISDDLRLNWNHWTKTGEITFAHAGQRDDGRW